jgi:Mor family transcriptional regulator
MRPPEFLAEGKKVVVGGSEIAASMAAIVAIKLREHGIKQDAADTIALDVLNEIRNEYRGQSIYFPGDYRLATTERDEEMYDQYQRNGLSIADIAQQYGLSIQWVYHVIRTVRVKRRALNKAKCEDERAAAHALWKRGN